MKALTKSLVLLSLLFSLAGCVTASKDDEDDVRVDYILLKNEAEQAYKNKDYKLAEKKFLKITKGVSRDPDAWFKLGNIFARTQRPNHAVRAYKEAIIRNSKLSKAWNNLAVVYLRQSLNAYTSLVKHAESDDPLIKIASARLEELYKLVDEQKPEIIPNDPTRPPEKK